MSGVVRNNRLCFVGLYQGHKPLLLIIRADALKSVHPLQIQIARANELSGETSRSTLLCPAISAIDRQFIDGAGFVGLAWTQYRGWEVRLVG